MTRRFFVTLLASVILISTVLRMANAADVPEKPIEVVLPAD